jgi:hypothetical protein
MDGWSLWFGLSMIQQKGRSRCGPCEAGAKEHNNTHTHTHTKIRNPSSSVGVGGAV